MGWRFHSVFQLILAAYVALHFYLARWLARRFDLYPHQHRLARNVLLLLAVSYPAAGMLERHLPRMLSSPFVWLASLWVGTMFIWTTVALATDGLCWLLSRTDWPEPTDRDAGVKALWLAGALSVLALWQGLSGPGVVREDIVLKGLPAALEGFTVVQVSDLHLSETVRASRLARIARTIDELSPDLVVLTGDIMDRGFQEPERACEALKSIRSRHGVVAVLGNHDYFAGAEASAGLYRRCGVRLLRNEAYEPVPGLQVAGLDDPRHGRVSAREVERLGQSLTADKPLLLLSHQPLRPEMLPKSGSGLVLSGHTHAGQVFPFGLFVRRTYRYFHGLYRHGDFQVYVTSGAGTWGPPMRLFTSSELPVFRLKSRP